MTTTTYCLARKGVLLLAVSCLFQTTVAGQSGTTLREDFYQPVQELWNKNTVETPDISSSYPSGGQYVQAPAASGISVPPVQAPPVQGPSFPSYTQNGPYEEIPAPNFAGGSYSADSSGTQTHDAGSYNNAPAYAAPPVSEPLPEIVGPVVETQPPAVSSNLPPLPVNTTPVSAAPVVPLTTGPVSTFVDDAYPETRKMFFRWDALSGIVEQNSSVAIGSPDAAGVFLSNGIPFPFTNSLSTGVFDNNTEWGNRYEFGELDSNGGWLASYLDWDRSQVVNAAGGGIQFNDPVGMLLGFADGNGDSIDDDIDGDNVYGRNGVDLGTPDPGNAGVFLPVFDGIIDATAPQDDGDLLTWVPIFDNIQARNDLDISSFELMKAWRRRRCGGRFGFTQHWMFGLRYIDLDERFSLNASGSFFDTMSINSSVENFIIGPQIGTELARRVGPFRVGGSARFTYAANFFRAEQAGSFGGGTGPGGRNQPVNLNASSFSNVFEEETFSPIFEWRVGIAYDIGKHMAVRAGYTGILIGDIGRASDSIEYTLPSFGLGVNPDDDLFFNAFTAGLEFYF